MRVATCLFITVPAVCFMKRVFIAVLEIVLKPEFVNNARGIYIKLENALDDQ